MSNGLTFLKGIPTAKDVEYKDGFYLYFPFFRFRVRHTQLNSFCAVAFHHIFSWGELVFNLETYKLIASERAVERQRD